SNPPPGILGCKTTVVCPLPGELSGVKTAAETAGIPELQKMTIEAITLAIVKYDLRIRTEKQAFVMTSRSLAMT
ncbi:MAG: hypothetical protein ACRC62_30995, partial [Microcoleus sp.]